MTRDNIISIGIATYNGERFIREQLDSILPQLKADDEILIVDDASTDSTVEEVEGYCDNRIKVFRNERNIGVIKSIEKALGKASGGYIFFADQDDIWANNKVERILDQFNHDPDNLAVVSNAYLMDGSKGEILEKTFFEIRKSGKGIIKNIYKNTYIGCCMAIRKEILRWILPFPDRMDMHDVWIGLIAEIYGKTVFLDECLVYYRIHDGNQRGLISKKNFKKRISDRWFLFSELLRKHLKKI